MEYQSAIKYPKNILIRNSKDFEFKFYGTSTSSAYSKNIYFLILSSNLLLFKYK